jgi:DNA-binding HxlR family transcriptional regulator
MATTKKQKSVCPLFHRAIELIGKRWSGAILRVLLDGPARFSEIQERVPDLSDRLLSERLKELEEAGVLDRTVDEGRPVQVTYRLTKRGEALEPVLDQIGAWAETWLREKR